MALLDFVGTGPEDPRWQAASTMAQSLLGRGSGLQRLSAGMGNYGNVLQVLKDQELKRALLDAQIQETQAQAENRRQLSMIAEQKRAQERARQDAYRRSYVTPEQQAMGSFGGPTNAAAEAVPGMTGRFDQQALIRNLIESDPESAFQMSQTKPTKLEHVSPGGTLFDPVANRAVFTAQPEPEKAPELVRTWEAAKSGGYQGSLADWKTLSAPRTTLNPMTRIENFLPASEQLQKAQAEALIKNSESLSNAPSTLGALKQAKRLAANNSFVGSMGDTKLELAKFWNNNLGGNIKPEQVANAETLRSALFVNVMENLKKMDAQPSEMQQRMMMDAMGKLTTDPNALPQIIDMWTNIIETKVKAHNSKVKEAARKINFLNDPTVMLDASMPTAEDIAAEAARRAGRR
jgi:hypothetical protein